MRRSAGTLACAMVMWLAGCSKPVSEGTQPVVKTAKARGAYAIFVTNESSGNLTVIDSADFEAVGTHPLGKRPRGIRASPDGRTIYVALSGSPAAPNGSIGIRDNADFPKSREQYPLLTESVSPRPILQARSVTEPQISRRSLDPHLGPSTPISQSADGFGAPRFTKGLSCRPQPSCQAGGRVVAPRASYSPR